MNIRIENIGECKIAYLRQIGPYGPNNIKTMEKLKDWAQAQNLFNDDAIILGIAHDNPETTSPENCRYDAAIVIYKDYQVDDTVNVTEISGGLYATLKAKHTPKEIQNAWEQIFVELQATEYELDNRATFERYTGAMIGNGYCEICVPVMAK
ncbi:DNA gyrase inhibitor GyrI [Orenia metallireducens]|uniref:DNA gyrase inhibitor GyrI n=1 Tax=Orenia metallireducens TaxID=1413210 RepID=A0A285IMT3_9FIRM|nr:GyrI-like domain-containing protein [Orenia metallireducens]PRX16176.1 DNA gyrase inhibitor GyrI [Orenia metallireducens]SNY48271.1 DNA gyrase inhibitor GyrI [Orenia metallireducens]